MSWTNLDLAADVDLKGCEVTLHNKYLWNLFHDVENEMIITKTGRRMFPTFAVNVKKLNPNAHYCIILEMCLSSKNRYKYTSSTGWSPIGGEEVQSPHRVYIHPESPATGEHWMNRPINFAKLKLTNTLNAPNGQVVLSSMHKYIPRIIIARTSEPMSYPWVPHITTSFDCTKFVAVTAYQNDAVTQLKINHNPFAKGFRENGQARCKRKSRCSEDGDVSEELIDVVSCSSEDSVSVESNIWRPIPYTEPRNYHNPQHYSSYSLPTQQNPNKKRRGYPNFLLQSIVPELLT